MKKFFDEKLIDKHSLMQIKNNSFGNYEKICIGKDYKGIYRSLASNPMLVDKKNSYVLNSFGFRGPEFEQPSFVFAGCSQTFGLGVSENTIWGSTVANINNEEYLNISRPGASVQWIVQQLFSYFKKFGNPKNLFCLFPDFFRMELPLKENRLILHRNNEKTGIAQLHLANKFNYNHSTPKYSQLPHKAEDIFIPEIPLYISVQYIYLIEQYCKSNSINFVWSTWDLSTAGIIDFINKDESFKNYISINLEDWIISEELESYAPDSIQISCHQDLKEKYFHFFDKGADFEDPNSRRHMGAHLHAHIAEAFNERFVK